MAHSIPLERLGGVLPAGNIIVAKNNEIETMANDPEGSVV